jgi:hypothetical protein
VKKKRAKNAPKNGDDKNPTRKKKKKERKEKKERERERTCK